MCDTGIRFPPEVLARKLIVTSSDSQVEYVLTNGPNTGLRLGVNLTWDDDGVPHQMAATVAFDDGLREFFEHAWPTVPPTEASGVVDDRESMECAACAAKTGSPLLCEACLHNRALATERNDARRQLAALRQERDSLQEDRQQFVDMLDAARDERDKAQAEAYRLLQSKP